MGRKWPIFLYVSTKTTVRSTNTKFVFFSKKNFNDFKDLNAIQNLNGSQITLITIDMEQDKFIKHLTQLAEITVERAPRTANHREPVTAETVWRLGQEIEIDPKDNPTLTVKIKRIKHQPKMCEDCGLIVQNRVVTKKVYVYPQRHWREACESCTNTRNPNTNKFDLPTADSQPVFVNFYYVKNK